MSYDTSPAPWDLAAGNRWTIRSGDREIDGDSGNETIADANRNVIAYVAAGVENGTGALLAASPALRDALLGLMSLLNRRGEMQETPEMLRARAALKQAGAL